MATGGRAIGDTSIQHDISELLGARRRALLAGDADALAALLHEDYRYVDSLGRRLDRAAYLASRRDGEVTFTLHDVTEIEVRELTSGSATMATCRVHDIGEFRGQRFESKTRVVHLCVIDPASREWVFLFGQSTAEESSSA